MLPVGNHFPDQAVAGIRLLIFCLSFQLGIFLQGVSCVGQRHLQLHRRLAGLGGVRLVDDDGKPLALCIVHFLVYDGELLQGRHDNPLPVVQGIPQILRCLLIVDGTHGTELMVKARHRLLQLCIEVPPVRHDDDGRKDRFIFVVMEGCQAVGRPCYRIGLPGASRVLDQVIPAGVIFQNIGYQLPHHVQLVVAREEEALLRHGLFLAGGVLLFFLFGFKADELLDDVKQAVPPEHFLPDIGRHIVITRRLRVPGTAVISGTVRALVERKEPGIWALQFRRHPGLVQVHGKERQNPVIELESRLTPVAVVLPLQLRIVDALAGQLVLQLNGDDGDAIDRQHHVDGVVVGGRVMPLPDALADVLVIMPHGHLI